MQGRDERLHVGFAQLPSWEPAGVSSAFLTGCSPVGRTAPPGPRSPTCPRLCPCGSRGPSPGSRRGAAGNPGRFPRERGILTLSAASPRPTAGPTPRVSDNKRVISFIIIIILFSLSSVHVVVKSVAPSNGRRRPGRSARPVRGERGWGGQRHGEPGGASARERARILCIKSARKVLYNPAGGYPTGASPLPSAVLLCRCNCE